LDTKSFYILQISSWNKKLHIQIRLLVTHKDVRTVPTEEPAKDSFNFSSLFH